MRTPEIHEYCPEYWHRTGGGPSWAYAFLALDHRRVDAIGNVVANIDCAYCIDAPPHSPAGSQRSIARFAIPRITLRDLLGV